MKRAQKITSCMTRVSIEPNKIKQNKVENKHTPTYEHYQLVIGLNFTKYMLQSHKPHILDQGL